MIVGAIKTGRLTQNTDTSGSEIENNRNLAKEKNKTEICNKKQKSAKAQKLAGKKTNNGKKNWNWQNEQNLPKTDFGNNRNRQKRKNRLIRRKKVGKDTEIGIGMVPEKNPFF